MNHKEKHAHQRLVTVIGKLIGWHYDFGKEFDRDNFTGKMIHKLMSIQKDLELGDNHENK